jgi:hypothetical protein
MRILFYTIIYSKIPKMLCILGIEGVGVSLYWTLSTLVMREKCPNGTRCIKQATQEA